MPHSFDLKAYLQRIGHDAPVAPDLSTLRALAVAHVAAIPFENLSPLLGEAVELTPEAVERKLVQAHRGGYCFEQNLLFAEALRAVGFEVSGLIARVLWKRAEDTITPHTHMLLRIELAGESWLADVGFSGQTLTGALRSLFAVVEKLTAKYWPGNVVTSMLLSPRPGSRALTS